MLIVALVLAVIGLAALVTAVVTSNELVAWVCIAASVLGVILLIVDAIRERQRGGVAEDVTGLDESDAVETPEDSIDETYHTFDADYPEETDAVAAEADAVAADVDADADDLAEVDVDEVDESKRTSG